MRRLVILAFALLSACGPSAAELQIQKWDAEAATQKRLDRERQQQKAEQHKASERGSPVTGYVPGFTYVPSPDTRLCWSWLGGRSACMDNYDPYGQAPSYPL